MSPRTKTNIERFIGKAGPRPADPNACWEWQGYMHEWGYGRFHWRETPRRARNVNAHRAAYFLFVSDDIDGLYVDHLCRNRACVNPLHLEAVTCRENILRGEAPPAHNARATHCKRGHEFTPENTFDRYGQRLCATCERARWKRENAKRLKGRKPSPCGTNSRYTRGCRCSECRRAHAAYQHQYRTHQTEGEQCQVKKQIPYRPNS